MKFSKITSLLLFGTLFFLISFQTLHGQSSYQHNWYINVNAGLAQAHCDIQEHENHISKLPNETDLAYGVRLAKYISPVFALHAQYIMGKNKGERRRRDAYFYNEFQNIGLGTTINLSNLIWGVNKKRGLHIYGAAGIGLNYFRSKTNYLSDGYYIAYFGYKQEGSELKKSDPETSLDIPVGIGMVINVSKSFQLNMETNLHFLDTDRFEAFVSGDRNDAYYYTSIGLTYNFWKKKDKEEIPIDPIYVGIPDSILAKYDNMVNVDVIVPDTILSDSEIEVKCIINKADLSGKGELMQILPIGFNVTDTIFDGASRYEFNNYTLHLYWDELPADSIFEFTYHVELDHIHGYLPMTSVLYLEQIDREYTYENNLYITKDIPVEIPMDTIPEIIPVDTNLYVKDTLQPVLPEVEYKVQIRAAYKAIIPLEHLASRYHITEPIREDFVGNWYRYSIGSFETYTEAREYRNIIIKDHGVYDAFIVAFKDGIRLNSLSELKEIPDLTMDEPPLDNTIYEENGSYFRVQIMALQKNRIDPEDLARIYGIEEEISEEVYDDWRKYTIGAFKSITDAKAMKQKMIDKGIHDAFIIAYINGERFKIIIDK